MHNPIQFIEVRGEKREILLTPSLYNIAHERGWEIKANSDLLSIQSGYIKLIYAGLINAHQVRKYDNPLIGNLDIELIDVEIWAALNPKRLGEMINITFELLTGKKLSEAAKEQQEEIKKKKSFPFWEFIKKSF